MASLDREVPDARLEFSEVLGRTIRTGSPESLGVPSEAFAIAALRRGDPDEARRQLEYVVEESSRVYFIFSTWLRAMIDYGGANVVGFDKEVNRLTDIIGTPPPVVEPTAVAIEEARDAAAALDTGDVSTFDGAVSALRQVQRAVHDAMCDWCWGLLTLFHERLGEDRMDEVFRETIEPWVKERYAALTDMSPRDSFELTIEGMRAHFCGPGGSGLIDVSEDADRWVMSFDPCGTGGRMRRGDPLVGAVPRTEAPYNFAVTERAHDWSWGEAGVCLYCAHCAVVNEILPIEHDGAPMRVTEYPKAPGDPCRWIIYKDRSLVPDEAYQRVGKKPPARPTAG